MFVPDLSEWRPWRPDEVATRFADVAVPWCIVGGWALELHAGRSWRTHDDIEVAVPSRRFDEVAVALRPFELYVAGDGVVSPYPDRAHEQHQTWVREPSESAWRLDVFREPSAGGEWICRRDPRLRLPYSKVIERTAGGIPYARPELVLLFKAKAVRPKDDADFAEVLPTLSDAARLWLADALVLVHGEHPWLSRLAAR
jgi:hypothetical protein